MVTVIEAGLVPEVFIGIDWGGSEHRLCALDEHGAPLAKQRVSHDVAGLVQLDQLLSELATHGLVRVAIERSEGILVEHLLAGSTTSFPRGRGGVRRRPRDGIRRRCLRGRR